MIYYILFVEFLVAIIVCLLWERMRVNNNIIYCLEEIKTLKKQIKNN